MGARLWVLSEVRCGEDLGLAHEPDVGLAERESPRRQSGSALPRLHRACTGARGRSPALPLPSVQVGLV